MLVGGQAGNHIRLATQDQDVAHFQRASADGAAAIAGLHRNDSGSRVILQFHRILRQAGIGRTSPHAKLEQPIVQLVLFNERAGVPAEVGRDGPPAPVGQQALAEQHDNRDRSHHQRHADNGEFEIAEAADAGIMRGL